MKIFRLFISLFFLSIVWCFFLSGREFLMVKPIDNLHHVPTQATFAMRIDGTSLLKASAFSIILEANDKELIEAINVQIDEKRKRKGPSKSLGIDYLSDLVVYTLPFEEGQIIGFTYNLSRPDLMRKNASHTLNINEVYAINENIGVVLKYNGKTRLSPERRSKMIRLAEKIAFEPLKNTLTENISIREANKIIQLSSKGQMFGETTLFNRADVDLVLSDKGLTISGELYKNQLNKRAFHPANYSLKPDGLHLYTTLIPQKVQDTIYNFLSTNGLIIPKIHAISINYRGSTINNTDRNLIYSPDIDFLITFETDFDFKKAVSQSSILTSVKLKPTVEGLTNGIRNFIFKRIDSKTYLISSKNALIPEIKASNCLFCIAGKLDALTTIKGDKMILFFLENLPIFKTTKDFFAKTEGLKIEISNSKKNMASINGQFNFKKEFYPLNEFLKYSIQNNFIRVK